MPALPSLLRAVLIAIGLLALMPEQMLDIVEPAGPGATIAESAGQDTARPAISPHRAFAKGDRTGRGAATVGPASQQLPDDGSVSIPAVAASLALARNVGPLPQHAPSGRALALRPPVKPPKIG